MREERGMVYECIMEAEFKVGKNCEGSRKECWLCPGGLDYFLETAWNDCVKFAGFIIFPKFFCGVVNAILFFYDILCSLS